MSNIRNFITEKNQEKKELLKNMYQTIDELQGSLDVSLATPIEMDDFGISYTTNTNVLKAMNMYNTKTTCYDELKKIDDVINKLGGLSSFIPEILDNERKMIKELFLELSYVDFTRKEKNHTKSTYNLMLKMYNKLMESKDTELTAKCYKSLERIAMTSGDMNLYRHIQIVKKEMPEDVLKEMRTKEFEVPYKKCLDFIKECYNNPKISFMGEDYSTLRNKFLNAKTDNELQKDSLLYLNCGVELGIIQKDKIPNGIKLYMRNLPYEYEMYTKNILKEIEKFYECVEDINKGINEKGLELPIETKLKGYQIETIEDFVREQANIREDVLNLSENEKIPTEIRKEMKLYLNKTNITKIKENISKKINELEKLERKETIVGDEER